MHTLLEHRHHWLNRLQTLLLVVALLFICALTGSLLFGEQGIWITLAAGLFALLFEPVAAWRLTLYLYRARPIYPEEAPELWHILETLAQRAGLLAIPVPYYVPSPLINAFAVGSSKHSAIAVTDALLSELSLRELAGVLAHETAHIAHGDLRVMGLADAVSRITALMSMIGQLFLVFFIPMLLIDDVGFEINWSALLLLLFSPHLTLLVQLGLSRIREYDADIKAAMLTGDPLGLAQALARIEQTSRFWMGFFLPGWGNPEPSWLRTHPATEERIRRLRQLAITPYYPPLLHSSGSLSGYGISPVVRRPRWWMGGLWH